MQNYKKEDLVIFNMKKVPLVNYTSNSPEVFEIELNISVEEKIQFIDSQKKGVATYLLDLINKWELEKEHLPNQLDAIKSWVEINDYRKLLNKGDLLTYYLFTSKHDYLSSNCGKNKIYADQDIVHQWFHDLLIQMYYIEKEYFKLHDTFYMKLNEVRTYCEMYGTLNSSEIADIYWNGLTDVSEYNLDVYIELYQDLENYIKLLENKLINKLK